MAFSSIIIIDYTVSMISNGSHIMSLRRVNLDYEDTIINNLGTLD